MTASRCLALATLAGALTASRPAWTAEGEAVSTAAPERSWVLEPRAFLGVAVPVNYAARLYGGASDLGVGVAVGHPGARLRWRASFDAQLAADVGAGASLSFYRVGLGAAFTWRDHLLTALDVGPSLRHISLGDEISNSVLGGALVAELGWRFRPDARWALTLGARGSIAYYPGDYFYWGDVGACLSLERLGRR
jgi:hypothetical protein